jgi:ankyrin repeat protein
VLYLNLASSYISSIKAKIMQSPEILVKAVQSGALDRVKELIRQQPALIRSRTDAGIPITLLAAYYRQKAVFEWLMSQQPNPNIYEATAAGQTARVETLLKETPALLNAHATDGFPALGLACYFGQYAVAKLLVEKGADVNLVANNGSLVAPIHAAVAANSVDLTRLLLENGAQVDLAQAGGVTPLHSAAHRGNVALVELLLQHGARKDLKMDNGQTALDFAKADGHEAVEKLLE